MGQVDVLSAWAVMELTLLEVALNVLQIVKLVAQVDVLNVQAVMELTLLEVVSNVL